MTGVASTQFDLSKIDLASVDGRMALLTHIVDKCINGWTKQTVTPAGFVVETEERSYKDAITAIGLAHKMLADAPTEQKPLVINFVKGLPRQTELEPLAAIEATTDDHLDSEDLHNGYL